MISKFITQFRGEGSATPDTEKDCLGCRLVSGIGLLGIGVYVLANSKRPRKLESLSLKGLAAVAAGLGIARLANADFLKSSNSKEN